MKRKNQIIIIALIVVSIGMIVGFSILSKQLKIEGTTTIDSESFDVSITGINKYTFWNEANFVMGSALEESEEITKPTFTSDTATFNVILRDTNVDYAVNITNNGRIAAVVDDININKTSDSVEATLLNDIEGVYLAPGQSVTLVLDLKKAEVVESGESTVTVTIDTKQHTTESIKYPTPVIAFIPELFDDENKTVTVGLLPDFMSAINADEVGLLSTRWELYRAVDYTAEFELVDSRQSLMEYQSIDTSYDLSHLEPTDEPHDVYFKAKVTYQDGSELWSNMIKVVEYH